MNTNWLLGLLFCMLLFTACAPLLEFGEKNGLLTDQTDIIINHMIETGTDGLELDYKTNVKKAFENVSLAMNSESIFIFDALRYDFVKKLDGHHEEILLPDNVFIWDVVSTNLEGQIKHTVRIGSETEIHHQRSFPIKEYIRLLEEVGLHVIKRVKNEDRFILVCKKEM